MRSTSRSRSRTASSAGRFPRATATRASRTASTEEDRFDVYISDLCDETDFNPCVFGYAAARRQLRRVQRRAVQVQRPPRGRQRLLGVRRVGRRARPPGDDRPRVQPRAPVQPRHEPGRLDVRDRRRPGRRSRSSPTTTTGSAATWTPGRSESARSRSRRSDFHIYGSAVWNHWLENGDNSYGPDVILNAWESSRDVDAEGLRRRRLRRRDQGRGRRRLPAGVRRVHGGDRGVERPATATSPTPRSCRTSSAWAS